MRKKVVFGALLGAIFVAVVVIVLGIYGIIPGCATGPGNRNSVNIRITDVKDDMLEGIALDDGSHFNEGDIVKVRDVKDDIANTDLLIESGEAVKIYYFTKPDENGYIECNGIYEGTNKYEIIIEITEINEKAEVITGKALKDNVHFGTDDIVKLTDYETAFKKMDIAPKEGMVVRSTYRSKPYVDNYISCEEVIVEK